MAIDALYRDYFQKSRIFLYPLLGIRRGASVIPEITYIGWDGNIKPEDAKLITIYPKRTDKEYLNFEKHVLINHSRASDFIELNDKQLLITFDFSDMKDDWNHFINGEYSQLDVKLKRKIRDFFEKTSANYVYIDSYLFPEKYFNLYADLLGVNVNLLKSVGELCSKPNLERETLIATIMNLENKKILG
jgi:hypothetical protein